MPGDLQGNVLGKYRRQVEFGALVLLAVALLWWFGRGLDWDRVSIALKQSDWRLIGLAGVIVLAAYWWRAVRWRSFLAPLCKAGLRELWVATTVGFAAILLIGRTGEVVRPVVLPMRDRCAAAAAFVTIMIERVYDFMAVGPVFAASLVWFAGAGAYWRFWARSTSRFARARSLVLYRPVQHRFDGPSCDSTSGRGYPTTSNERRPGLLDQLAEHLAL
jgi:uncharacterized membrane protein YbhN (UPF0104 family)